MRRFIDFHLIAPNEIKEANKMISFAKKVGFQGIVMTFSGTPPTILKDNASNIGIDLFSRSDLRPNNLNELTIALRNHRRRYDIVAVYCSSKKVARQAAKDHRVDVLNFPDFPLRKSVGFDRSEASLASQASCCYEIN